MLRYGRFAGRVFGPPSLAYLAYSLATAGPREHYGRTTATSALLEDMAAAQQPSALSQILAPPEGVGGALEIGNWRGVGLGSRRRNRGRLDIGRNRPEVWTPPLPTELEPAALRRNRGRLDIGRNEVTVNVGPITVESRSADPREVAEEVADEIERRVRDRNLGLRDVLLADPTPEAVY